MYQHNAICEAALIAGLNVLRVLHGPCSVPFFLEFENYVPDIERTILVYDLGAGVSNVVLTVHESGIIEVKAAASNNHLGGEDFVDRLVIYFARQFNRKIRKRKLDVFTSKRALCRLRTQCEVAKCLLSSTSEANISIDQFYGGLDFHSSITRERFDELCLDLFQSTIEPVERVLRDANTDVSKVDDVIIVGGSSRIPRVQKLLTDYFRGKKPSRFVNLDEGEVSGLAIFAAMLARNQDPRLSNITLLDVLTTSIGIETKGGAMEKVVCRNSTIPGSGSTVFYTPRDWKQVLHFYEGESPQTKNNLLLGKVPLSPIILSSPEMTQTFVVTVRAENDRAIKVEVKNLGSGKSIVQWLQVFSMSKEDLEGVLEAEERYQLADEAEEARLLEFCALDARIAALCDSLGSSRPSEKILHLLELVGKIRDWVDQEPDASIDEYRLKNQTLDKVKTEWEAISLAGTEDEGLTGRSSQVQQDILTDTLNAANV